MQHSRWFCSRVRIAPAVVAVLALLVVSCAPAAAPTPTVAPAKPTPTVAPAKPAPKAISLPKPEVTSIKIGHAALEANGFPPEFAKETGLYKKYGIEKAESFYFDGAAKALQALVAGQVDVITSTGGPVLSSLTAGVPLVQVTMHLNKMTDGLFTVGSVKSAADLKGKSVAISQFGGESHAAVLLSLKGLGLTDKDVTIVQIGGQSARIAALAAGSVAAAPVDETRADQMKGQGFNLLVKLSETPLEFARNGLILSQDWVKKNPNTTLVLVAGELEAMQLLFTQTDKAIDEFAKWTQMKDKTQAEKDLRDFMKVARRDLRWSKGAWDILKDVQVMANPAVKDVDVTKGYTFEFLDKLKEMGFNDAVGVPKS